MKFLTKFIVFFIAFILLQPNPVEAKYEQFFEKVHYNHIDRTIPPALEAPKVLSAEDSELNIYIWGSLNEPYTQKFMLETFPQIQSNYPNANFIFNHRTFVFHGPEGLNIAKLTECTAAQSKLWENIQTIIEITNKEAENIDLIEVSQSQLQACLNKNETTLVINEANSDADILGINSIPTIIIKNPNPDPNLFDIKVLGAHEFAVFAEAIEQTTTDINSPSIENIDVTPAINIEERTASLEAEIRLIKEEQSFVQSQIEKLVALIDSLLNTIQL